jgi:hypothetical protein
MIISPAAAWNLSVSNGRCATRDLNFRDKIIKASEVHASFMAALSAPYAAVISSKEIIDSKASTSR